MHTEEGRADSETRFSCELRSGKIESVRYFRRWMTPAWEVRQKVSEDAGSDYVLRSGAMLMVMVTWEVRW